MDLLHAILTLYSQKINFKKSKQISKAKLEKFPHTYYTAQLM
jgi:hypothetical protein